MSRTLHAIAPGALLAIVLLGLAQVPTTPAQPAAPPALRDGTLRRLQGVMLEPLQDHRSFGRITTMLLRRAPSWPPLLIGLTIIVSSISRTVMGDPQTGAAFAGAGIFLAMLAFAPRADRHVTRMDPPPPCVDPTCTPPMEGGE